MILAEGLLVKYERIPLEKGDSEVVAPDCLRPLDIFAMSIRLISGSTMSMLREWKLSVLPAAQYSQTGGTLAAIARLTYFAEGVRSKRLSILAVSLDYSKLFNMIGPQVAHEAAMPMGMAPQTAHMVVAPIIHARGIWRLAGNVCPERGHSRGLPQGLSTSVCLADLFVSILI